MYFVYHAECILYFAYCILQFLAAECMIGIIYRVYVSPNSKLSKRFPAIDRSFIYIPKPISVGQTDVSIKFLQCTVFCDIDINILSTQD